MTEEDRPPTTVQTVRQDGEPLGLTFQTRYTFAFQWESETGAIALTGESDPILGFSSGSDITEQQIRSKLHPEELTKLTATFKGLTPDRPQSQIVHRVIHSARGVIFVETDVRAIFDQFGRMLRIFGKVSDVTAHHSPGTELAMTSDWLQLALEAGKSVGWDWDVRSGRDTWFGDLKTIFGIPSRTYVGRIEDFRRRVHSDDQSQVWKAISDAREGRKPYSTEFRIVRPDGSVRWVAATGKFYYSFNGEPERMVGIAADITEHRLTQDALRQKDAELIESQRLAVAGSWLWDPANDTVTWSDELHRIAGRDSGMPALRYREQAQFFTAESWERLRRADEKALWTGQPYEIELEMVHADGSTRWIIGRGETQRDLTGRTIGLHTTALKILAGKQKEGLLRISPMAIGTTGEAMTLADKAILEDAFGCETSSMYGCTEHLTMGLSTPGGKSMILYDDDLHYEFFDDHSLVTNLFNYTLPLIRYRMSDILRPVANSRLTTPYIEIESLVGRTEMMPMFINRDGAEDFISPHTINELFVAGVTRFQMHLLSKTSFRFMVCLDSHLNPSQRAAAVTGMEHRLRQVLDQKLMNNVTFDVIATDDLPVNPKTRKFNLIIDARSSAASNSAPSAT